MSAAVRPRDCCDSCARLTQEEIVVSHFPITWWRSPDLVAEKQILVSFSNGAAAAFRELHHRLKSLEDTVQGSVESGTRGVMTRLPSSNSVSVPVEL